MFCPECRDEFREGFTRCASCEVDLVGDLSSVESTPARGPDPILAVSVVDYCGFLSLDDAREARDTLHVAGTPTQIVIRNLTAGTPTAPVKEEFWLQVPKDAVRRVAAILGDLEPAESEPTESLSCSDCGKPVQSEEQFCPHCGARFR